MSQENNFVPEQGSYKPLTPFQLFVKSNFPFIEATYEALDNYGLYCKIVEYLNDVISNENTVEDNVTALYNAFVSLNTYVSNYFDNLDVQEEINNKLDEMAENGTFSTIISTYFQPIVDNQDERINEINSKVNRVASGNPLAASSTSEMTDTDRIYVNTTDGYWYYYNGTAWTQGSVYQSTVDDDAVDRLQNDIDIIKEGLNFEKLSSNMLDPDDMFMNNARFDVNGVIFADSRGFRLYCLNVGENYNLSIKINSPFFWKIEANTNQVASNGAIVGADNTTYVDTTSTGTPTSLSFTTTKQYVFLMFFPASPTASLSTTTTEIMVTNTLTAQNYVPFGPESKINVTNEKYEKTFSVFNQAYIKNSELLGVVNKSIIATRSGTYTGIEMKSNVIKMKAKVKFFGNSFITLIITPNGSSYITDITKKSIHINISKSYYYIGHFDNLVLTNTETGIMAGLSDNTEYEIGVEIDPTLNKLTVLLPNEQEYEETNADYTACIGKYAIFEHFHEYGSGTFLTSHLCEISAESEENEKFYDDFARYDGAISTSPTGHVYHQFSNNNPQDWEI